MKTFFLMTAAVLALGMKAQAGLDSCAFAGEDQKLECAQEKLENKIRRLNQLLDKVERELNEELSEQMAEGDLEEAQGLQLLKYAVQKIKKEILEAQSDLAKLVEKHHAIDKNLEADRAEVKKSWKDLIAKLKAKAERLENKIEDIFKRPVQ